LPKHFDVILKSYIKKGKSDLPMRTKKVFSQKGDRSLRLLRRNDNQEIADKLFIVSVPLSRIKIIHARLELKRLLIWLKFAIRNNIVLL